MAQRKRQPAAFRNECHGEGERAELLAQQTGPPAAAGKLSARELFVAEASRPGFGAVADVELHADGSICSRFWKAQDQGDEARECPGAAFDGRAALCLSGALVHVADLDGQTVPGDAQKACVEGIAGDAWAVRRHPRNRSAYCGSGKKHASRRPNQRSRFRAMRS